MLDRAWQALELHQRQSPESLHYSILKLVTADAEASSETLAHRLSEQLGRPYRADAFRQQLRRARQHFAKLVIDEVRQTLHNPSNESIEQELIDLDLMSSVRDYWQQSES